MGFVVGLDASDKEHISLPSRHVSWHEQTMDRAQLADPILVSFRTALEEAYGSRLERVILYGSRARGDARPDSDYDIAVFLRDMPDRAVELDRLADLGTDFLYKTGEFVHAMPYLAATYNDPRMPLMHEIRREGRDL
ncbi:MAG: nucleotidyltransferase domain-containing protein [Roseiarcus sp.]